MMASAILVSPFHPEPAPDDFAAPLGIRFRRLRKAAMSRVDVIVVNHNGGRWLPRTFAALEAQTFRDFQIIVIDNASTDGSVDAVDTGGIPTTVVRAERNLGFAAANNLALHRYVRADRVALLNPDAFPDPAWLEALVDASQKHPEFTAFGSCMRSHPDGGKLDGIGDVYHASGLYWRDGHGCPSTAAPKTPREIFAPCAAAALYRTRDLIEAGGFDESFFCYGEDVDLGFRLRLAGHRALYVPDATVAHVGSGLTGHASDFAVYHGHRNLVWNYVKNMPPGLFWACLPAHLLLNLVSLIVFALRGRAGVLWRAKADALRGLPEMWQKRREVQNRRAVATATIWHAVQKGVPRRGCRDR